MTNEPTLHESLPDPGDVPMIDVLAAYAEGGFDKSFDVTDDSTVECHECAAVSVPADVSMSSLRRLEGASDPDDMVAVVAITCPACGAKGTAVLKYGPMATMQESEVLKGLRDDRADTTAPGNSAHGETTGDDSPTA